MDWARLIRGAGRGCRPWPPAARARPLGRSHRLEEADQRHPLGEGSHLLERGRLHPGHDGRPGQGGGGGVEDGGPSLPVGIVGEPGRLPAPASTTTSIPVRASLAATSGTTATRSSPGCDSLMTASFTARGIQQYGGST